MRSKVKYYGKGRDYIYIRVCLYGLIMAVIVGAIALFCNYQNWGDHYDLMKEYWVNSDESLLSEASYSLNSVAEDIRIGTRGITLCEVLCILIFVRQRFYLRKSTNAIWTVKRLPKKGKMFFELHKAPVISFILVNIFKLFYIILSLGWFWQQEDGRVVVVILLKKIWRILL